MIIELNDKMEKTIERMKSQFSTYRTGRANADVLAKVTVEYYGSMVPLKQVASISVPEPMTLQLTLFDKSVIKSVEKAIQASDLGLNPMVDGTIIRLRFPELTEQRRKDLVKMVKKQAEESKIAVRNIRRDAVEGLKAKEKNKDINEDESKKIQEDIQKQTDHYIHVIDLMTADKEKDIMRI